MNRIPSQYKILGKIGEGSGGEVYAAWNSHLNQKVVLKKIKTGVQDYVDHRAEVDVLKNLRHSYLPKVLDFFNSGNDVYTVMDFIPGESFKEYLLRGEYFEERYVIRWAKQICETLVYLHSQNPPIIHSDLKPGNIMLMPDGNICVIDFNIAASLKGDGAAVTGYTKGYAPPEQVRALRYNQQEPDPNRWLRIDPRADIYSFGATIYHLLAMEKPVQDRYGFTEDIRKKRPDLHEVFASIIMKCLEPDPGRRYQNAWEVLQDLQNINKMDHRYRHLRIRQRVAYGAVFVMMAAFAGLGVFGFVKMRQDRNQEYDALVRKEQRCIEEGAYENLEEYYEDAIHLNPKKVDAYLKKAIALDAQDRYTENIDFIENEVLSNSDLVNGQDPLEDIYYLLGNAYDQQGDYQSAAQNYKKAIDLNPGYGACYRNYAIALANLNDIDGAEAALQDAREHGVDNPSLLYVEGEIMYNTARYEEAKEKFLSSVEQTGEEDLKMRGYLMAAKCLDGMGKTPEFLVEKVNLLEQASQVISEENNFSILEQLGQAYTELASASQNIGYYNNAIETFQKIIDQGKAGYNIYNSLERCYQNIHDYDRASQVLQQMVELFGENYRTYRDYAFMESARQQSLPDVQRDYEAFRSYYERATELYRKTANGNVNDMEMERLQRLYEDVVSAGWLAG